MQITEESTSRTTRVGDFDVHYQDAGSGPVVICIHGLGPGATGWSNFARNLEFFAQSYRVIAPDLPNFGRSTKVEIPPKTYSFYAEVILGLMDALNVEKASLVGNSLGGGIFRSRSRWTGRIESRN